MKDSNPPECDPGLVVPNPDVQLSAIDEIGTPSKASTCLLFYKDGEPWVRILALGPDDTGPTGWASKDAANLASSPFVLTPEHIVVVGAGAYAIITSGWGKDARKQRCALVEGLPIKGTVRPPWIDPKDWAMFPPDVVRVIHPRCPPILYTRRQSCLDVGTIEELFTTTGSIRILT